MSKCKHCGQKLPLTETQELLLDDLLEACESKDKNVGLECVRMIAKQCLELGVEWCDVKEVVEGCDQYMICSWHVEGAKTDDDMVESIMLQSEFCGYDEDLGPICKECCQQSLEDNAV